MNLPEEYICRMRNLLGDEELEQYLAALDEPRLYGLRVNTSKITTEEFEKIAPFPIRKIPYIENGYFYDGEKYQPAKHPYYFAGLYYLQDPSAMTPASRLPVSPGDRVLDLCAAPGGKSTELAAGLRGEGLLVANDISAKRAKALQKNIELFGFANTLITTEYPEKLAVYFPSFFDKILIDAPCSGEGMFRKDPDMVKAWDEASPSRYAAMQEDIVRHALPMLAPGGYLLYSTCTFSPSEDEGTVMKILKMDPELHPVDIDGYEGFSPGRPDAVPEGVDCLKKCVRIFPHKMEGEGHFLALFRKDGTKEDPVFVRKKKSDRKSLSKEERFLWEEFAEGLNREFGTDRIETHDGKLFYEEDGLPSVNGLRFLRKGVFLGECKKNRFEPSQALAMTLRMEEYENTLNLPADDERVIRYLKGETLLSENLASNGGQSAGTGDEPPGDGWVLVCVDGFPLGWGKKTQNTIKNKYHSSWRLM